MPTVPRRQHHSQVRPMIDDPRPLPTWHTLCRWAEQADERGSHTTWQARYLDCLALLTEANAIIEQCTCQETENKP
jgi:hypothetical protein